MTIEEIEEMPLVKSGCFTAQIGLWVEPDLKEMYELLTKKYKVRASEIARRALRRDLTLALAKVSRKKA